MSGRAFSTVHFKTLPNGARLDLETFRYKKAIDWDVDDLVGWMIHVARKYGIPLEEMNMHRFAGCTGGHLSLLTEQNFVERDPKFGALLFKEFFALTGEPSTGQTEMRPESKSLLVRPQLLQSSEASVSGPAKVAPLSKSDRALSKKSAAPTIATVDGGRHHGKRTHYKSGNKLWEFIRDTLRNPETCPSIVRWENREEGIFRIVESEKMARLWGMKKNNSRMTYEKLSRAMRYYYNSKIILPVSGRRLVYRFGPNATDWKPTVRL